MVIGIFGPQSSGKSTLLNFLFGCDFLSSDGRCTNGVYGTYYEVSGQNIYNCEGFLILDTEGLFSNYKRKCAEG
jgi:ABC-type lipoprotein export system ATPase subunit